MSSPLEELSDEELDELEELLDELDDDEELELEDDEELLDELEDDDEDPEPLAPSGPPCWGGKVAMREP